MDAWQWQTWQGKSYLTCRLLDPFPHGFFTREFRPDSPLTLVEGLTADAVVYRTHQVHGNVIADTRSLPPMSEASRKETLPQADGLLSDRTNESVWVCTADCTPVLIGDIAQGRVAAIHSGWRGTAAKIVPEAIAQFWNRGSQSADIRVALGPAISGDVYQVSLDVAAQVAATLLPGNPKQEAEAMIAALSGFDDTPVLPDTEPGKVRLDVRRAILHQLYRLGLAPEQIAIAPHCTYQDDERFFSYRRTRKKYVQWSGIVAPTVTT
ncbi:peptidoglycan editing factor PgeF [Sodalinema gerasimenkoae]|uniref:peptidoglycan editing factor PgeF n=1 Tax=Sodalinema gerasimenkoae TaxID=2862348 RepID=UPI0013584DF5|nr:peptidoglycan editing factor PgeF [Sodalinema gerasimenkoae]